mmetsp:Transcript_20569/g.56787  ORF Transcript_20569/g.56787 Transcript_20569/m.56787 type:complete len:114 (+) Transcript_20569:739-1080(+)
MRKNPSTRWQIDDFLLQSRLFPESNQAVARCAGSDKGKFSLSIPNQGSDISASVDPLPVELVNAFLEYAMDENARPLFERRRTFDITANISPSEPQGFSRQDPVYMIVATKRR